MRHFYLLTLLLCYSIMEAGQGIKLVPIEHLSSRTITEAITTQPSGKTILMQRDGLEMYAFQGMAFARDLIAGSIYVTFGDDGEVYFKNFISGLPVIKDVWIKGKLEGDKLVIDLPQVAAYEEVRGKVVAEAAYALDNLLIDEEPDLPILADNQTITFTYQDSTFTQDDTRMIGLGEPLPNDFGYYGYGNAQDTIRPFHAVENKIPEGLKFEKYAMSYYGCNQYVDLALDNSHVYIRGLMPELPDGTIMGEIENDKVTFASSQFLGINPLTTQLVFFLTLEQEEDEQIIMTDGIKFNYDAPSHRLTPENPMSGFILNAGESQIAYFNAFLSPEFFIDLDYGKAAVPADPIIIEYKELPESDWEAYGMVELKFATPFESKEGNIIDANNLYYSIYVNNDSLVTLKASDYLSLSQDMTQIHALYADDWDFMRDGMVHTLYLYFNDYKRIGVRSIYKAGGEERMSQIVYIDHSEIENIIDSGSPAKVEYFNLIGQRVSEDYQGFCIRTAHSPNHRIQVTKIIK